MDNLQPLPPSDATPDGRAALPNAAADDAGGVDSAGSGHGEDAVQEDGEGADRRPSRRTAWLAMGAVALALGLIWVAPGADDHPVTTGSSEASGDFPGEPEDANAAGKAAPLHFTLKDMNGVDVSLASFKGKVILLNFWATWCGPCKAEIPSLVELQQEYGDKLVVLGLSVDDTVEKMRPYAVEYKINYPLLVGSGREDVQDAFGPMWGIPVSVIIDREGKIAKKHSGIGTKAQFEREIKALL
jgi:cytochrome c biogenesis protein CcmG/thiol:disulfide interchange protein DsbE